MALRILDIGYSHSVLCQDVEEILDWWVGEKAKTLPDVFPPAACRAFISCMYSFGCWPFYQELSLQHLSLHQSLGLPCQARTKKQDKQASIPLTACSTSCLGLLPSGRFCFCLRCFAASTQRTITLGNTQKHNCTGKFSTISLFPAGWKRVRTEFFLSSLSFFLPGRGKGMVG